MLTKVKESADNYRNVQGVPVRAWHPKAVDHFARHDGRLYALALVTYRSGR